MSRIPKLKVAAKKSLIRLRFAILAVATAALFVPAPAMSKVQAVSIPSTSNSGVSLDAHLHRPAGGGRAPAVVLMHGCGGWQPAVKQGLEKYAKFLVGNGFVVLNVDSFGPRGNQGGTVCQSLNRLSAARRYRTSDAYDALQFLRAQPFVDAKSVFLIGQSNGGSVAMIAAMERTRRSQIGGQQGFRGVYPRRSAGRLGSAHGMPADDRARTEIASARLCERGPFLRRARASPSLLGQPCRIQSVGSTRRKVGNPAILQYAHVRPSSLLAGVTNMHIFDALYFCRASFSRRGDGFWIN
jgi:acetyl esterase/lipase